MVSFKPEKTLMVFTTNMKKLQLELRLDIHRSQYVSIKSHDLLQQDNKLIPINCESEHYICMYICIEVLKAFIWALQHLHTYLHAISPSICTTPSLPPLPHSSFPSFLNPHPTQPSLLLLQAEASMWGLAVASAQSVPPAAIPLPTSCDASHLACGPGMAGQGSSIAAGGGRGPGSSCRRVLHVDRP